MLTLALGALAYAALASSHEGVAHDDDGALDIGAYRRTFVEDFEDFDVSAWGPGSRWIAHTPWAGDFGDAEFVDPQPDFPFSNRTGLLTPDNFRLLICQELFAMN